MMEYDIKTIKYAIEQAAQAKADAAGYSGAHHDGGSGLLRAQLRFFLLGIASVQDGIINRKIKIPDEWEEHFQYLDPEYEEYIRLSKKFG